MCLPVVHVSVANIHAMRKSLETLRSAALRAPEQSVVDTDYVTSTTEDGPDAPADAPSSAPSAWGKLTGMFALPWVSASAAAASQLPPPPVMSSSSHVEDGENNEGSDAGETPLQAVSGLSFGHIGDDSAWHAHVAESAWLNHCAAVLCAASRVSTVVNRDAVSVLVHCSDGWDRTAQVWCLM